MDRPQIERTLVAERRELLGEHLIVVVDLHPK
jgi:hypothetical protein